MDRDAAQVQAQEPDAPPSGDERVRLNLWLFNGTAPTDGQPVEVIIDSFVFTPLP